MKSIYINRIDNQITSKYVNFSIKLEDQSLYNQVYIIENLIINIILSQNLLQHYDINILNLKNII